MDQVNHIGRNLVNPLHKIISQSHINDKTLLHHDGKLKVGQLDILHNLHHLFAIVFATQQLFLLPAINI